jgi:DNA-binding MarR family transcriptional regulator
MLYKQFSSIEAAVMCSSSLCRYIALLIRRGVKEAKELASILNISEEDAKEKLREMESRNFVKCNEKGFWKFRKFICNLTSKGFELAEEAEKELIEIRKIIEKEAEKFREINVDEFESYRKALENILIYNHSIRYILPILVLVWSNLLPLMFIPLTLPLHIYIDENEFEDLVM